MFKKLILAVVPMLMTAGVVRANDDLLSAIAKLDKSTAVASASVKAEDKLGKNDVDALLGDSEKDGEEAIAACFRKIGYGHSYGSYNSYNYCQPSYSYNSYSCYSPSYTCYTPSYTSCYSTCYTPVTYSYTYQAPVTYSSCYTPCYTSYWGCW